MIEELEATLPRWEGPQAVLPGPAPGGIEGAGWFGQVGNTKDAAKRIKAVAIAVDGYKDAS